MLARLKASPPDDCMYVLYLTTKEMAPAGCKTTAGAQDLQDPNTHVIYWEDDELAVDTAQMQNAKIADLDTFLEYRRPLWLSLVCTNTKSKEEEILVSQAVSAYLDARGQNCSKILWLLLVIAIVVVGVLYWQKWI
jgi:hypothetical protein